MNQQFEQDPAAAAVLGGLQNTFAGHGSVVTMELNAQGIVAEFRPGSDVTDNVLSQVPKPALDWAFSVELGTIHDGARLCAVVFNKWPRLQAFYATNPGLHGTLVTCWHGAAAIWLRAMGRLPRNFAADDVHWCANGTIPVGDPQLAPETFISASGAIKMVDFKQLVWNEQQQDLIMRLEVEQEVGPPFRTVARGKRLLNVAFWSKYIQSMVPISYDPERNSFVINTGPENVPLLLNFDQATKEFTVVLELAAKSFGPQFPRGEIRPERVRQLLERIKLATTATRVSDDEMLDLFIESELVPTPGKDVAVQEIQESFTQLCMKNRRRPRSPSWVYRRLAKRIEVKLGMDPRHDIIRHGKQVRGYSGLGLKPTAPAKNPDGSDSADAADGSDGA